MSMPRYTCAESTLMISTGSKAAMRMASSLLPVAVGPAMAMPPGSAAASAMGLPAAQEQMVELGQRHARERGPAMVALAGALGLFHLPQQRVHLGQREAATRMHGTAAGQRGEQPVLGAFHMVRAFIARHRQRGLAHQR